MSRRKNIGTAVPRLQQDYLSLKRDPVPYIRAEPSPDDMLEWHYVIQGPADTPYLGGYYHGTLVFTQQYPFKPPSIYMRTPNGRFETNRRLCLSISDYHPDEWNPSWSVSSILTGLLSFMLETSQALGTVECSAQQRVRYARASLAWNVKQERFRELFPDVTEEIELKLRVQQERHDRAVAEAQAAAERLRVASGGAVGEEGDGQAAAAAVAAAAAASEAAAVAAGGAGGVGAARRLAAAGDSDWDWSTLMNNVLLLVFAGLMGLVCYHVLAIMSAE